MAKKTTRFGHFLLVFSEWTTIKFEHCFNDSFIVLFVEPFVKIVIKVIVLNNV